jgi:hypothetical protein
VTRDYFLYERAAARAIEPSALIQEHQPKRNGERRRRGSSFPGSLRKNEMPSGTIPEPYLRHLLGFSLANEPGCTRHS